MRILLVGVACIGKSTVGKLLAEMMEYNERTYFFDKKTNPRIYR
jgi:shikimate kinase